MEQSLPYDIKHGETDKIIEAMAKNEELIGGLYAIYSKIFPTFSSFWDELSAEEKIHAGWLRALGKKINEKNAYFRPGRFNLESIEGFKRHVEQLITEAGQISSMEIIVALSNALDLENSLLENKFFEVAEGDLSELKHTFESLRVNTEEHQSKVRRIWEQKRVRESTK